MKNVIILFFLLINGFIYSQNIDTLKLKQFYKEIDSITYTTVDFSTFKKHYIENEEVYEFISKKAASGDKNTSDFLNVLSLSYKEAKERFGERDIKILIYSYFKSTRILDKFKKLDAKFQATNDSLKISGAILKKEIDSLNKN
jgi:hypothetical protein